MIDPAEAEGSANIRARERGHGKANARAKAKVGESSSKRLLQFKKSTVVIQKREISHECSCWLGSARLRRGEESCCSRACGTAKTIAHEDDDTSSGESDGTSGTSASTESDAEVVPERRRGQGTYHKPRPPRKKNPLAFIQLSPALQSDLTGVERHTVLQLHLEDDYRPRCEQCIRLATHCLREHQQVREVMVNVSRNWLRPMWVLANPGRKDWNNRYVFLVHIKKDIERNRWNLGPPSIQQMEKLCRAVKMSDEATEALKHCSCHVCGRLKQPPARRQVAIAHADMFNDVVSMNVNFWKLEELNSREQKTLTILNLVDAASEMHIAAGVPNQTSHTMWKTFAHGWLRWAGASKCLIVDARRAQISKEFFDQAEGRGIFVDPVPAEAHWHVEQVEHHARYLRMMGNRTMEDLDITEADFQQLQVD